MPAGDGTGPAGMGPMTGRAAGYCAGYPVPGYMNPIGGRGFGAFGRGGGWGRRNQFYATGLTGWQRGAMGAGAYGAPPAYPTPYAAPFGPGATTDAGAYGVPLAYPTPYAAPFGPAATKEQQLDALKGQAEYFEDALEGIRKQIEELQSQASKKTK